MIFHLQQEMLNLLIMTQKIYPILNPMIYEICDAMMSTLDRVHF